MRALRVLASLEGPLRKLRFLRCISAAKKAKSALFECRVALVQRFFVRSHSSPHSSRIYRQANHAALLRRTVASRCCATDASRTATRFTAINPNRYASHHSARSSSFHNKLRSHASRRISPEVLPGTLTAYAAERLSFLVAGENIPHIILKKMSELSWLPRSGP